MKHPGPVHKLLFFTSALFLFAPKTRAQNLIANPGFEHINICCEREAPCSPEGWFGEKLWVYERSFISIEPVYKVQFNGKSSIEIETGSPDFIMEYAPRVAITPLLLPLQKGEQYTLTLNVLPKLYAVDELHVVFSDSVFPDVLKQGPDITFMMPKGRFIEDRRNWVELRAVYTARGGERFMSIGMMKPTKKIRYRRLSKLKGIGSYYYDDLSLKPFKPIDEKYNLDSAERYIYAENRRHSYDRLCAGSNVLFPEILTESLIDSVTTMPGILKRSRITIYNANIENRNILQRLSYINDTELSQGRYEALDVLIAAMKKNPDLRVKLTGFVDKSDYKYDGFNYALLHAKAVAAYLVEHGIHQSRITCESMGSSDPIGDPKTDEGRKLNNRVEYLLTENP